MCSVALAPLPVQSTPSVMHSTSLEAVHMFVHGEQAEGCLVKRCHYFVNGACSQLEPSGSEMGVACCQLKPAGAEMGVACCVRSVAFGQRAPNRATAREVGRGLGAGMKGGSGAAVAPPRSPHDRDRCVRTYFPNLESLEAYK